MGARPAARLTTLYGMGTTTLKRKATRASHRGRCPLSYPPRPCGPSPRIRATAGRPAHLDRPYRMQPPNVSPSAVSMTPQKSPKSAPEATFSGYPAHGRKMNVTAFATRYVNGPGTRLLDQSAYWTRWSEPAPSTASCPVLPSALTTKTPTTATTASASTPAIIGPRHLYPAHPTCKGRLNCPPLSSRVSFTCK